MNGQSTFARRLAERLAAHAAHIMPRNRAHWTQAMRRELEHVPGSAAALQWAAGCVLASYIERIRIMNMGTLRASRWVLGFEMIMCFWWLTWMFGALASRGVYGFAGPLPMDAWFFMMLSGTVAGPIGLIVAFKSIVLGRPALSRIGLAVLCVPVAWTSIAYSAEFMTRGHGWLDGLGLLVLFAVLPVLGAAHLVYLSRAESRKAPVSPLAV